MNFNYKFNTSIRGKNSYMADIVAISLASKTRKMPTNKEVLNELNKLITFTKVKID